MLNRLIYYVKPAANDEVIRPHRWLRVPVACRPEINNEHVPVSNRTTQTARRLQIRYKQPAEPSHKPQAQGQKPQAPKPTQSRMVNIASF